MKATAEYLDKKMRSAAAAVGKRSPLDIAILAAMEITEEILSVRRSKEELLNQADERISSFARRLEDDTRISSSNPDAPAANDASSSPTPSDVDPSTDGGPSEIPPPTPRF